MYQLLKALFGRGAIAASEFRPPCEQRRGFHGGARIGHERIDFALRVFEERGPLQQWFGQIGRQSPDDLAREVGIAGFERESYPLLDQRRVEAASAVQPGKRAITLQKTARRQPCL